MNDTKSDQLLCVECVELHRRAEFCPVHPDEPLLDPTDDDVILELISIDDKARGRTFTFWGVLMGVVGFALGIATYYLVKSGSALVAEAYRLEIVGGAIVGMGAIGLLIAKLRFRRRFVRWTAARDGGES